MPLILSIVAVACIVLTLGANVNNVWYFSTEAKYSQNLKC